MGGEVRGSGMRSLLWYMVVADFCGVAVDDLFQKKDVTGSKSLGEEAEQRGLKMSLLQISVKAEAKYVPVYKCLCYKYVIHSEISDEITMNDSKEFKSQRQSHRYKGMENELYCIIQPVTLWQKPL